MPRPSLTGSESFQFRIQRSEAARALLMCGVYGTLIPLGVARWFAGGSIVSGNRVLVAGVAVLLAALAYEVYFALVLRAALRRNRLVQEWRLAANACIELAVPGLLLGIVHVWSAQGMHSALFAPTLLLFPMTILLSVLRLRPRTTLWLGMGAAVIHGLLVVDTIRSEHLQPDQYPTLLSYGALLVLTGIAGMLVSRAARRYVAEAVEEAEAREMAALRLANVERDLEVARQIQIDLLPAKPPGFAGFDVAGMNRPADQTGGDYYDWQELPNGRLLVAIADVTGHGIGPALVMAVCRAYVRASAPLDTSPASLMARLNALLHADEIGGRFVTLAMAALDAGGEIELVSAGHGPSLFFRAGDRRVEQFGGDGLPLAISAEEIYGPSRQIAMARDDVLVLLTDGVVEWQNAAGVQFGADRIAQALLDTSSLPAAQIVERLDRAVRTHADGSPQTDDVTIVVIKRTG
jgi:serine phosphatase RsbU (regulator of sigma subunit)